MPRPSRNLIVKNAISSIVNTVGDQCENNHSYQRNSKKWAHQFVDGLVGQCAIVLMCYGLHQRKIYLDGIRIAAIYLLVNDLTEMISIGTLVD